MSRGEYTPGILADMTELSGKPRIAAPKVEKMPMAGLDVAENMTPDWLNKRMAKLRRLRDANPPGSPKYDKYNFQIEQSMRTLDEID